METVERGKQQKQGQDSERDKKENNTTLKWGDSLLEEEERALSDLGRRSNAVLGTVLIGLAAEGNVS